MTDQAASNTGGGPAVAIIGMAGRFPGADTVEAFWANLCAGVESIRRFEEAELDDWFDAETRRAPNYVKARPIVENVEQFDAEFFGMHAREAELTDPQHRLFLECAWEALEDGGYDPARYGGAIGVFAGASLNTYFLNNICRDRAVIERFTSSYQVGCYPELVGAGQDFLATRIAYKLDLKGPAVTLATACSTSLLAVAQACQCLLLYQADMALAGGVSISLPQKRGYLHQEGGMVSADGHCRPFDAAASGTVFGSGAGCVLLKRLSDALADGDHVYAVIRGWGVNNDGAGKVGFTAPSADGQAAAIEMALATAGVEPRSIGYVECHGTATPLGDPIEIAGLAKAFAGTADPQFCAIGSVKGNIGHLDAAAGIAGLIKAALALGHRKLPPSLHYRKPNPEIDFAATPFYVNAALADWPATFNTRNGAEPRRAGVSAFGVGGTNVHVVLEEAPAAGAAADVRDQAQLLLLSARGEEALGAARANLAQHIGRHPEQRLADIAYSLQLGRRGFEHRAALLCRDRQEAAAALAASHLSNCQISNCGLRSGRVIAKDPPVVFMFPGQGAQYPDMGRGLYEREPEFRLHVDDCAELLKPLLRADLREVIYPRGDRAAAERQLLATVIAQPAIFTVEYALARLWMSWGVGPAAMVGHSIGEFVAAVLAGVLSLEDALAVVAERGRLIQNLPGGTMLAVRLPAAEVEALLAPPLAIAAINGPSLSVVAGPRDAVERFAERLGAKGVMTRRLHTSHAFHSPMMDPIIEPLAACLRRRSLSQPTLPYVSAVTGDWAKAEETTSPEFWARHARAPVRFAAALATLAADRWPVLLEVGPGNALATLALQARRDGDRGLVLGSLPDATRQQTDRDVMLESLGQLWIAGTAPDWAALHGPAAARVPLPTYPFQRRRHWIDPPPRSAAVVPATDAPLATAPQGEPLVRESSTHAPAPPTAVATGTPTGADDRSTALRAKLAAIFEDLSGEKLADANAATSFLEMGFDSLFLSQVTQRIQSQFKVKIAFRQLLGDHATIPALADFIATQMPAPAAAKTPPVGISLPGAPPIDTPAADAPTADTQNGHRFDQPAPQRPSRFEVYRAGKKAPVAGMGAEITPVQRAHIDRLAARYAAKTAGSKRRTEAWRPVLADPRAVAGFRAEWKELVYPIVCARSEGARIWDVDGNEYIDLVNGYGQTAFGHAPDFVVEAVTAQLAKGFAIGPQAELAGEVATLFTEITGNERVTFCNTGSEAVMAALRVARTVTGRSKVVLFNGGYHGQFDEVLVRGVTRPDGTPRTLPVAAGIPYSAVENVVVLDYATPAALQWVEQNAADLAAVVVEPVQSRHPDLQPLDFLRRLRQITEASGTAFVMDEVVTGFRVHLGGMQAVAGIRADLATYGKVLGGGLPIGILAGKAKFMDALDGGAWRYGDESVPEVGVTFFAGTFVRHPLTLAATLAVLKHLQAHGRILHEQVAARGKALAQELGALFREYGLQTPVENYSSFIYFDLFNEHPLARLMFHHLRLRGIHIQDGFPCFLTTAHGEAEIARIVAAFRDSLEEMRELGIFAPVPAEVPALILVDQPAAQPPATEPAVVPLSESQMEIWLAAQRGDDASCAFNESVTLRLDGRLDQAAFETAVNRVIARHDALRAAFGETGEAMRIAPRLELSLPVEDLAGVGDLQAAIDQDARTPFDLAQGPLVRGRLLRLAPEAHAFIFTAHHIICDGWSTNVILSEIAAIYASLTGGPAEALPEPFAFADYVRQEQRQPDEALGKTEAYWLSQFAEPAARLDLPLDRPRAAVKTYGGGSRCRRIEPALHRAVKEAGARQGCTLFVTLLAAFQLLMGRLGEQEDVVVGIPTAGQSLQENESLVGQCVNFLPIRGRWTADASMAALLAATREKVLQAYEHQTYTLGTLVRRLAPAREANRLPLTEIQFNLERLADKFPLPGLEIAVEPNPKAHVNFDIFLNVIESEAGLRIDCDYNSDLWDAATIDRWLDCYAAVLQAIAADVEQPVGRISYLPAAEQHRLADFDRTAADYAREATVHALFEAQARARPEALAVRCGDSALTYAELDRRANALAALLAAGGVAPGGLVGVLVKRSPEMLIALLAVLKSGNAYIPLDPAHPRSRLQQILGEAAVSALVIDDAAMAAMSPGGALIIDVTATDLTATDVKGAPASERPAVAAEALAAETLAAEAIAYVIYTSGSTGVPKGVEVTHRSVVNLLTAMAREPGLGARDSLLAVTTVSFDIAALELFLPLAVGGTTVIARREEVGDGFKLLDRLQAAQATAMQATPASWRLLLEAGFRAGPGFKMLCGGEALPRDLAEKLLQGEGELWNMYGPTETTIWSSCKRIESAEAPITVGRPIANTEFHVLDGYGQHVPFGKPGELHIGGDGVSRGYHRRPDLTAEKFVANPFGTGRLYRTGDVARRLPNGEIEILGRLDQQIKLRGFRIEPGEIELALTRHLGLAAAVVMLRQDMPGGAQLVAYYVEHPGVEHSAESSGALRARLATILPDYMIPAAWMRLDRLPLLPNGKLDRQGLPKPETTLPRPETTTAAAAAEDDRGQPRSPVQAMLAKIWAQVLGLERVGLRDDLLDLGADSIHLFQITARANKEGLRVSAKQLIQHRTVEEVARQLGDGGGERPSLGISSLKQFRQSRAARQPADRPNTAV